MGVPNNPVQYIGLSTLELDNVEPTNHDKLDLAMDSDKSVSVLSCTVLTKVLPSEYKYIDPDLSTLLLQASQQWKTLPLKIVQKSDYIHPNLYALLLQASQQFGSTTVESNSKNKVILKSLRKAICQKTL